MFKALFCLAVVLLAAGCHSGHDETAAANSFELAELNYEHRKYDQAKIMYLRTLEACPDHAQAKVGLGHACREYGNLLYRNAADLVAQNRSNEAQKVFGDASENHLLAFMTFKGLQDADSETAAQARYGVGLLHYQRATSSTNFPFPLDDRLNRHQERDKAITELKWVSDNVPGIFVAHRYLGLAYFAAGSFAEGRVHLKTYHDKQQMVYEQVARSPGSTEQEKKKKDGQLRMVEREIQDVREILGEYFMSLQRQRDKLEMKKDRTPEELQTLARLARESLEMENYLKSFKLVSMGEAELELRQRCQNFLDVFNKGLIMEIMSFMAYAPGEEAQIRRSIEERLAKGVKYRKVQYRTLVIEGLNATVGITCDQVTEKGTRSGVEFSLRWRTLGGQWKATEVP